MTRYDPLAIVDQKVRDYVEQKKVVEPVCSLYFGSEKAKAPATSEAAVSEIAPVGSKVAPRNGKTAKPRVA